MAALKVAKMELFAQARAQGLSQNKAALKAGYDPSCSSSRGCRLDNDPRVKARIAELSARVEQATITASGISKSWVIDELIKNIADARAEKQYAVVRQCLVDIGKELRMFVERTEHTEIWNGDPATLTEGQLNNLIEKLETLAYGDDRAALERDKRRALREAGMISAAAAEVIEVQPEQGDPNAKSEESNETTQGESWTAAE